MKRSPVRRVNHKRLAKRRAEQFGPKARWLRMLMCVVLRSSLKVVCGEDNERRPFADEVFTAVRAARCDGPTEAAHTKSQGAGGKAKHLIPLCSAHHHEQHTRGIKTFAAKYNLDLVALAEQYELMWRNYRGEA